MLAGKPRLKKQLKLRNLFSLSLGSIIGVGWITVLGAWMTQAGSVGSIFAFIGGGLIMLLIGLCYSEVAGMFPVSGGEVAYLYEMYGVKTSFFAGWFLALNYIGLTAFEAISIGWVLSAMFPSIEGPVIYTILGTDVRLVSLVIGLAMMTFITVVNYRGAKSTAWLQDAMTYTLLLVSAVFIFAGVTSGDTANLQPLFVEIRPGAGIWIGIVAVMATTPFWFAGFDTIPQAMGEKADSSSSKLLPRVISFSIGLALLFYVLVILAATMSAPRSELLAMDLPAAGALESALGSPLMGKVVLFAGLCGLVTTWNAIFFAASRLIFALGRGFMLPPAFAGVHTRFASPAFAILFVGIVGGSLSLLGRNAILPIVNVGAIAMSFVFLLVTIGLLTLRRSRPNQDRPYRVPGGATIPVIAAIGCLGMLIVGLREPWQNGGGTVPIEWVFLAGWGGIGGAFWIAAKRTRESINASERRSLMLEQDP